jgi:hypothetical protein
MMGKKKIFAKEFFCMVFCLCLSAVDTSRAQNAGDTQEYVNSSPAFSISYPTDWIKLPMAGPLQVLRVGAAGPTPSPALAVTVYVAASPFLDGYPVERSAKDLANALAQVGKDVRILYEKPSKLRSGTPAYEAEFEYVIDTAKVNVLMVATKTEDQRMIMATMGSRDGRVGDELKKILYTLNMK